MNRLCILLLVILCLVSFAVPSVNAWSQATLEQALAYLKDIPGVAWVRSDGNSVIMGANSLPSDIQLIAQSAVFNGNRTINFGVHVWVVPSSNTGEAYKQYYGMTTARYGKITKAYGKYMA